MEAKAPDGSPPDLKLVAHPRAKSKVWKYFGFDADAEGCILQWRRIYCRVCRAQIAYSGNTSNLSYHLEKNHPEQFCQFVRSSAENMREALSSACSKLKPEGGGAVSGAAVAAMPGSVPGPGPAGSPPSPQQAPGAEGRRQRELTAAVLRLLCQGLHPASLVDEPGFRALLRAAEPRYELPGGRFFAARAIPERRAAVRQRVRRELAGAAWCGVALDAWRSRGQRRSYVTLTVHFLTAGAPGRLAATARCLGTVEVPEEDAAESLTRQLYEAFVEWGVGDKLAGATTDAGKDVARACSLLDVPVQVPCLARTLDAAVQRALRLPRLAGLLARCGRLVQYFQGSPAAARLLAEQQRCQGAAPQMLRSDRAGGWGATLAMLRCLLDQQFAVAAVLLQDTNSHHLMLEAAEWAAVRALVELLAPLRHVAEALCAPRYPTISMLKPMLHMLLGTALSPRDSDTKELGTAKELMARELAAAYRDAPEVDMFLNVATFLDPRYKRLPFLSALERQQVENRVLAEASAALDRLGEASPGGAPPPEDGGPVEAAVSEEPAAKRPAPAAGATPGGAIHELLADMFCPAGGVDAQEERQAQLLEELSNFKSQKVLALDGDPLRWWGDRLALFPTLPRVLRKYWCVAATRAPAQRLFCSSANVLHAKRSRLAPALVDAQVFLYENARAGLGLGGDSPGDGGDGGAPCPEPEPEEEDEGEWGLDPEQLCAPGDGLAGGDFGSRDPSFP